jgi:hypothetical protein
MSIDGWRPGRDADGWRLGEAEMAAGRESDDESDSEEPPALGPLQPYYNILELLVQGFYIRLLYKIEKYVHIYVQRTPLTNKIS